MKKQRAIKPIDLVPNNPRYDREHSLANGMDAKEYKKAIRDTLYDTAYRTTHSGHRVAWDEPTGDKELEIADKVRSAMQQRRAAAGRNRLRVKQAIPTRKSTGGKLFDEFMLEALGGESPSRQPSRLAGWNTDDLQNLYNASQHLDFDRWTVFFTDLQKSNI